MKNLNLKLTNYQNLECYNKLIIKFDRSFYNIDVLNNRFRGTSQIKINDNIFNNCNVQDMCMDSKNYIFIVNYKKN